MNEREPEASEITEMLRDWSDGKREAADKLLPLVYAELHRQAARFLRKERSDHTLQTTALINEAYLKLVEGRDANWQNRTHFFAVAANVMRQILIDYAKAKHRLKRGGDNVKVSLTDAAASAAAKDETGVDLIALNEALERLEKFDRQQARVVELRYFGGLSLEETAEALRVSRSTVARDWETARAWLHRELTK